MGLLKTAPDKSAKLIFSESPNEVAGPDVGSRTPESWGMLGRLPDSRFGKTALVESNSVLVFYSIQLRHLPSRDVFTLWLRKLDFRAALFDTKLESPSTHEQVVMWLNVWYHLVSLFFAKTQHFFLVTQCFQLSLYQLQNKKEMPAHRTRFKRVAFLFPPTCEQR